MAFMMIAGPTGMAQACAGGSGDDYNPLYMDMHAGPGEVATKAVKVDESRSVDIHSMGGGTVYVMTKEEKANYDEGKEFETVAEVNSTEGMEWVEMKKGDYWVVLDNSENTAEAEAMADAAYRTDECGSGAPMFIPSFQFEVLGVAIGIGVTLGVAVRKFGPV